LHACTGSAEDDRRDAVQADSDTGGSQATDISSDGADGGDGLDGTTLDSQRDDTQDVADDADVGDGTPPTARLTVPAEVIAGTTFVVVLELADIDKDLSHIRLRTTDALGVHEIELNVEALGLTAEGGRYERERRAEVLIVGPNTIEVMPVDLAGHVGVPASAATQLVAVTTGAAPIIDAWAPRVAAWRRPTGPRDRLTPRFELVGRDVDDDIARLRVRVTDPDGAVALRELPLIRPGDVSPLTLTATAPLGTWRVVAQLIDTAGHVSEAREATLTIGDAGAPAPTIEGVSPGTIEAGTEITVVGRGLGDPQRVVVAGVDLGLTSASDTTLVGPFPDGAGSGSLRVEVPDGVAFAPEPTVVPPRLVIAAPPVVCARGEASLSVRAVSSLDSAIVWQASAGTVTPGDDTRDATLVAPAAAGIIDVAARLASDPEVVASTTIKVLPPPSEGESGGTVGAAGGTVVLADGRAVLVVPPGALASPVAITGAMVDAQAPPGRRSLGAVELGPDGTTFAKPVTLRLMLAARRPPGRILALRQVLPNGSFGPETAAAVVDDGRFVEAAITHFSLEAVDERAPVCAGDPPVVTRVEPAEILEGQTTPLRLIGHNLTPEMRTAVRLGDQATDDVGLFVWFGQYQQAGIGVMVDTIPSLVTGTRTYTLRLTDTCDRVTDVPFVVRGLPELETSGLTRWTGPDQPARELYSSIDIDGVVEVGSVARHLAATGRVRVRGVVLADGRAGLGADGDDAGVGVDTSAYGGDGRDTDDDNPPPPTRPEPRPHELGHGEPGARCSRSIFGTPECVADAGSPRGGKPGVDNNVISDVVSLVTSAIETVFNAVACVGTLGVACASLVVSVLRLVDNVSNLVVSVSDNGELLAMHGEGGQGATRRGYGGGGGGGGGYRSYVIASSDGGGGGAGGQAGRELQIAAGGRIELTGVVTLRGGDGGAGAEDGSSGAGGGGGAGGFLDLRSGSAIVLSDGARLEIGAGRGGPSGPIIEEVEVDGEDRDVTFDIPGKDATEHGQVVLNDRAGFVGLGVVVSGGLPFGGVTDDTSLRIVVSSAEASPTLNLSQSDAAASCETCGPTCGACKLVLPQPSRTATVTLSPGFATLMPEFVSVAEIPMAQALTERVLIVGADLDGDGLADIEEELIGSDPGIADEDGDGLDDGTERTLTTVPWDPDSDDDGVDDRDEVLTGTNPVVADSDIDGWPDGLEPRFGTDPTDGDSDDDGVRDACEHYYLADPMDPDDSPDGVTGRPLYVAKNGRLGIWDDTLALVADVGVPAFGLGFGLAFAPDGRLHAATIASLVEVDPLVATTSTIGALGAGIASITLANGDPPIVGGRFEPLLGVEGQLGPEDFVQTGQVLTIDRSTGRATRLGAPLADPVLALAWSPQGVLYATLDRAPDVLATIDLTACDLDAGTCTSGPGVTVVGALVDPACASGCADRAYGLAWVPDADALVVALAGPTTSVLLTVDPSTADAVRLGEPGGVVTGLAFGRARGEPVIDCATLPESSPCSDGDPCTRGDTCTSGACVASGPTVCDDGLPCTTERCDSVLGCVATIQPAACVIGGVCLEPTQWSPTDRCLVCLPSASQTTYSPKVCADTNPCTDDVCLDGTCQHTSNTAPCDDGFYCTTSDRCASGACVGSERDCTMLDSSCGTGLCDEVSDVCRVEPAQPSATCCAGPADCDDDDPCTVDTCTLATGVCTSTPAAANAPCDDGDACTIADRCVSGACQGTPVGGGDVDGDGHTSICGGGDDCDDDDELVHPGAPDSIDALHHADELVMVPTNVMKAPHMALDSDGRRLVAWYEGTARVLMLSHDRALASTGTLVPGPDYHTWTHAVVDASSTDVGRDPRIAVDADDAVHIAYVDTANNTLRYATDVGGTWVRTTVATNVAASLGIGIVAGAPHIIFRDQVGDTRRVILPGLVAPVIATTVDLGQTRDAIVDATGVVHVAGIRQSNPEQGMVRYGRFDGALVAESVEVTVRRDWVIVRLDELGAPVLLFPDLDSSSNPALMLATRDAGGWSAVPGFAPTFGSFPAADPWDMAFVDRRFTLCGGWSDGVMWLTTVDGRRADPARSSFRRNQSGQDCALAVGPDHRMTLVRAFPFGTGNLSLVDETAMVDPVREVVARNVHAAGPIRGPDGRLHVLHVGPYGISEASLEGDGWHHRHVVPPVVQPPPQPPPALPLPPVPEPDRTDPAVAVDANTTWAAWREDGKVYLAAGTSAGFAAPIEIGLGADPAIGVRGGEPIVAYAGGGTVRVAARSGGSWSDEATGPTTDSAPVFAISSSGICHIVVRAPTAGGSPHELRYVKGVPGAWGAPEALVAGDLAASVAVAVASDGAPHVVYYDVTTKALRHVYSPTGATGTWTSETVSVATPTSAPQLSVTLDSVSDAVYVAASNGLGYVWRRAADGTWATLLDTWDLGLNEPSSPTTLGLAAANGSWWLVSGTETARIFHWTNTLPSWVEGAGRMFDARHGKAPVYSRALLAPDGTAHAAWSGDAHAARDAGGLWFENERIPFAGPVAGSALALAPTDSVAWIVGNSFIGATGYAYAPHDRIVSGMVLAGQGVGPVAAFVGAAVFEVFSFAPTTGALTNTTTTSASTSTTIDAAVGLPASTTDPSQFALDAVRAPDGRLHVVWYAPTGGDLRYATRGASETSWVIETVATTGDVGTFATIARKANGGLRIVYYDKTNQDLKIAERDGGSWQTTTLDGATGKVGTWARLVAMGDDLMVAYRDEDTKSLVVQVDWGGGWQRFVVEGGDVATELGLAATEDGRALVLHKIAGTSRLRATWLEVENHVDDDCDGR